MKTDDPALQALLTIFNLKLQKIDYKLKMTFIVEGILIQGELVKAEEYYKAVLAALVEGKGDTRGTSEKENQEISDLWMKEAEKSMESNLEEFIYLKNPIIFSFSGNMSPDNFPYIRLKESSINGWSLSLLSPIENQEIKQPKRTKQ